MQTAAVRPRALHDLRRVRRDAGVRRHLSPSAELRVGEQMRLRLGMIFAMLLTFGAMATLVQLVR